MENLVTYEFICINDLEKSFKLNIKKSQEDFNNLNWLLNLAEKTVASKDDRFLFKGTLDQKSHKLFKNADQPNQNKKLSC